MPINRQRLRERFLRYVAVDTTAKPDAKVYPSSPGQRELGMMLATDLEDMGLADVVHNEHGLVLAMIPGQIADAPTVALNAHLDTSPETSGAGVRPQVIEDYLGGDITLPGDSSKVIRVSDNPELNDLHGRTLITTDGTTLLGGDDKAGLAVIMELAATLSNSSAYQHGPVRILFTCDEEIGHGVDHVDLEQLAADVCYTLDGPGASRIDVETFSADLAVVTFHGVNIHPAIAKNRMVNAIRVAAEFVSRLPRHTMAPEATDGRDGFVHPYQLAGGVEQVQLRVLLRDFDTDKLADQASLLQRTAREVEGCFPGTSIDIDVQTQYRNLGDGLSHDPRVVEFAELAHSRLGRTAERHIIRGGTDGSRLTELGLPTPNLSTGQHNPHSPLEWVCLDEMVAAAEVLVELVQVWATAP